MKNLFSPFSFTFLESFTQYVSIMVSCGTTSWLVQAFTQALQFQLGRIFGVTFEIFVVVLVIFGCCWGASTTLFFH